MSWLDWLTEEPAPIYGQHVRRVVFDSEPMPQARVLKPERAEIRAAESRYRWRRRQKQRSALVAQLMERMG